ncbi:fimbria/pilus outer membrane usher protein [Allosphingosinicella sp.]|jgi:outer membrane usher protein|uniref:fimbria/pilus outer membrane usher protein n=1 Tax=Allosphingosinicella sp. TaxID=2823234 RepID=UPI002F128BCF
MPKRSSPAAAIRLCLLPLLLSSAAGAYAADSSAAPVFQPTLLDVTVNGQAADEPLLLLQDAGGALYASEATLRQWRIRLPSSEPVRHEGEAYYRIDNLPALSATFSAAEQSLVIRAQPDQFDRQRSNLGATDSIEMTPAGTGGFLNYDLFADYFQGAASLNGAVEVGAFTPMGVGTSRFILRAGEGGEHLLRLETSWAIDRPGSLSSIRIGDGITGAGPGTSPLRFGGIQYARNFAVQPGYLTMPLPVLEGSAAVPSVVDIYVNNALQGSRQVTPGPFELTNVPVQSGGGTVQLVMRDLLGRQVVSEQSYYASSVLLRRGLHDFTYELGFAREGFGRRSNGYGQLIASTSHRYGISDSTTLEGHFQASADHQLAGAGVSVGLFDVAMVSAAASVSRSDRGTGAYLSASAERRSADFSFGLRAEYAGARYAYLGMADGDRPARLSTQAFADMPVAGGTIGFNLIHRDRREEENENLAGLFANVRLMDSANVQLFARRAVAGEAQTVLGAHVAFALGGRRSASASVEYRGGSFAHNISYQDSAPAGIGSGHRAATSLVDGRRSMESLYTHNAASASFGAHLSHTGGSTGIRLSASGALGLVGDRPFLSRALGSSFAEVRVGRHKGVRVYADNQLIGVTDSGGRLVVPSLRAFDRNLIRIDEGDLPLDVQLPQTELAIRPFARSGALVAFAPRRERGVLMQVRLDDGSALPAGALVRIEGDEAIYVAASGGEIYVPSLSGAASLEASWNTGRCTFRVAVPDNDDPQPRIEGLICEAAAVYAAR